MTKIQPHWLKSNASKYLVEIFANAGFELFFVGGCVRNALLDAAVTDLDCATSARPDEVVALAEKAGVKCIPTGVEHGTVTLVFESVPYEVTTFRQDVATDGRRATVSYSDSLEDDARRRDFTMNALYCSGDGTVVDPLDGLPDLRSGRVRFIGEAEHRIKEDYLRILRFFRFFAWFGRQSEGLDATGLAACSANLAGLDALSRERVGHEVLKLLCAPHPEMAIGAMDASGVLTAILPGAGCRQLFALSTLAPSVDALTRLAALTGAMELSEVIDRLRLSKEQRNKLTLYRDHTSGAATLSEVAYRHGEQVANSVNLLRASSLETSLDPKSDEEIARSAQQVFPLRAKDLPHLQGAELGAALKWGEQKWIQSGFELGKRDLVALIERGQ